MASTVTLPLNDHGWFLSENAEHLEDFIKKIDPKVVVELGSWLGKSTIFMAKLLSKGSKLYAIDTWLGIPNSVYAHLYPTLYVQFLSNCKINKVTNIIIPVRMSTDEAAIGLNVTADLIYIDASHDEENVFKDVTSWYPKLNVNGIMCGNDWSWQSVRNAVTRAAQILNKEIFTKGNFWYFLPKSADEVKEN